MMKIEEQRDLVMTKISTERWKWEHRIDKRETKPR